LSEPQDREDTPASDISDTTPKVMAGPTLPVELQMEEPVTMETEVDDVSKKKKDKKKKFVRTAAGVIWEDPSLDEWEISIIIDTFCLFIYLFTIGVHTFLEIILQ
jgi:hypothetical protein